MMHWLWTLLNTPKIQMTVLQEIELTVAIVGCGALLVLGVGFAFYVISSKR
jgi:hypothetical protein